MKCKHKWHLYNYSSKTSEEIGGKIFNLDGEWAFICSECGEKKVLK